jgi:dCTP deaminase
MILTKSAILKHRAEGNIRIDPFNLSDLNPNSYNLHLAPNILTYKKVNEGYYGEGVLQPLDPKVQSPTLEHTIPKEGMILHPGELYLAQTIEYTETRFLVPMIEGRSSWGRMGLFIHVTAGFGDVGFRGHWTLEMSVIRPMIIYPFVPICQIFYHSIDGICEEYQSEKYQDNKGVQPSMLWKEAHKW